MVHIILRFDIKKIGSNSQFFYVEIEMQKYFLFNKFCVSNQSSSILQSDFF